MLMDIELLRTSPIIRGWLDERDQQVKAEAEAQVKAEAVLRILDKRGILLNDAECERIATCADQARLDAWLEAAIDAATADDLFR